MLVVDENKQATLSLTDNFPVQVQLSIFSSDDGYTAYVCADGGKFHAFHIECTPSDIEELNLELQRAIERVASSYSNHEAFGTALSALAQKGKYAFKRIFTEGVPRDLIRRALKTGATVQIVTKNFVIPWELLYDDPSGSQIDISCFWGMSYIITRSLIQDARPGDLVSPLINSSRPSVGIIACDELEHVVEREIPALRKLHEDGHLRLFFLSSLDMDNRDRGLAAFGRFLGKRLDIVHLACHACEKKPLSQSYLLVNTHFDITMEEFGVWEFTMRYHPFVVLNACLTGTINPLYTLNWAAIFWKCGARGVLATEFHVPDLFASAFSKELYRQLLSNKPIGEALLAVRRYFWEEEGQHNPLGLAYALYSSPSIRIVSSD